MTDDETEVIPCVQAGYGCEGVAPDWGEMCPVCQREYDDQAAYYGAMFRAERHQREAAELDAEGLKDDPRTPAYWETRMDRADIAKKTARGE